MLVKTAVPVVLSTARGHASGKGAAGSSHGVLAHSLNAASSFARSTAGPMLNSKV